MSSIRSILLSSCAAAIVVGVSAHAALAEKAVALSGERMLTSFDTKTRKAGKPVEIKGVAGRVVGIDRRPSDGALYAVSTDGSVYTVDPANGQATMKVKLETMLPPGVIATVDFNPVADRLRLLGSDGTSLRANVDDGKVIVDGRLKYADGDKAFGKTPKIVAGAYSNSVKGTKETALYDIDGALGTFLKQAPPNDGILVTMGDMSVKGDGIAFDISTAADGRNSGYALAAGKLHTVDIATGAVKALGPVAGLPDGVRDMAMISD
jgi:outer membrane protein assembly factor BamB